jgi:filamentous hemagglutinin family protein
MTQQKPTATFKLKPLPACVRLAIVGGALIGSGSPVHAELPIPAQDWATMGAASHQLIDNGNTLSIDQQSQAAILNWEKFNVGAHNKVEFNQPNSSAIALNRIIDADASKILGQITANGQIYLYNQNGFVFGKDSSVNANTLVASTLNISDETLTNGLTKQTGLGIDKPALGANDASEPATLATSAITVEKGAKIQANGDANNDGLVVLAAPQVTNKGSISTNEFGQVILVASKDKVYLQTTDSKSPFAGLLVEVDTGGDGAGHVDKDGKPLHGVDNLGDILVRQGNITLEGFTVNQGGRLTATTSVNVNGSIRLLAQEKHFNDGGKLYATKTLRDDTGDGSVTESSVTFDSGSLTEIVADTATSDTAIDAKAQAQSYMDVIANKIDLKSGSSIVAPNGNINMIAAHDLSIIDHQSNTLLLPTTPPSTPSPGRILMEKNATIDVSGTRHVQVAMERNVGEVSVQTFDLRDAPLQKGGVLQGQTVRVDIREKTPIVDISGATNNIQRSIQERLVKGGEVNLTSSGDVVVGSGAVVNIAGGSIDYQDGYINTTKLLTDYGKIVDISAADPNQHYASVFGVFKEAHPKWGITKVWDSSEQFSRGQFEKGYSEGQSAGSVNIQAPQLAWNAKLLAGSSAGIHQREVASQPFGGAFVINEADGQNGRSYVSSQNVVFQAAGNTVALDNIGSNFPTQPDGVTPADLTLSRALINDSGVQKVLINTAGNISIANDADINVAGAKISLNAGSIDVHGHVYAAGGAITLATNNLSADANKVGEITLDSTASLDVSGRWVNDFATGFSATPVEPLNIDGGAVSLTAIGDLTLKSGSAIKADGGAHLALNGGVTEGKGGAISLAAVGNSFPSSLHLDGQLSASGLSEGGSLSLTSAKIAVGSAPTSTDVNGITPLVLGVSNGQLDVLANSGFAKINLKSHDDTLTVSADTQLKLLAQNRVLNDDFNQQASADSLAGFTHVETLPEHLRHPVDLSLTGLTGVSLATGSQIIGDTGAAISLASSEGGIYVDGTITAPAGSIDLTIKANSSSTIYNPTQAVWLGSHAQLLATGATKMQPSDALNRRSGEVLDGGSVTLTAQRGYVIQEQGSVIDVSGTKAKLDLPIANSETSAISYRATEVGSNAGSITVAAGEGVVLEGGIKGAAGSATTRNGRFDLTLDPSLRDVPPDAEASFPSNAKVIKVVQHSDTVIKDHFIYGDALDNFPGPLAENSLNGQATISSDSLKAGGFGDVRLTSRDEIRFVGGVNLNASQRIELTSQKIGWAADGSLDNTVKLNTPYLKVGTDAVLINPNFNAPLESGAGKFIANTQWTDLVGPSRWDGFKTITLRSAHDLRTMGVFDLNQQKYLGSLKTAANLYLKASQIYPTTLTDFTFTVDKALNPNGIINIKGNNHNDEIPLSANGVLSFVAPNINQNGVLRAPFGTINLNASSNLTLGSKSITSVSAEGKIIPFGKTQGGLFWLYPLFNGTNLVFNASAQGYRPIQSKQLNLTSPQVTMAAGSKINVAGGGDLQAYEFISGAGGTYDYLSPNSPSYQGGFAVVPTLGSSLAPSDPTQKLEVARLSQELQANYAVGSQIHLNGSDKLAAGTYTILPARYALLSGAFLVTPQANSQDQTITTYNAAGLPIVPGYQTLAGTGTKDARTHGFLIESGADIRNHSKYDEQTANQFFANQAATNETSVPLIPKDSGQIAIDASNKLIIEGSINSTPAEDANGLGRGGKLDIAATNGINIIGAPNAAAKNSNNLEILATDLNKLNLDSLFLGGSRNRDNATGETQLSVKAKNVEIDSGVSLKVKDLVIAAKDKVTVKSGATLTASGAVNTGDSVFKVTGYGALLRVSSDKQVSLSAESTRRANGDLAIEQGATINGLATGNSSSTLASVLLSSSKTATLGGDIVMTGGSLSVDVNAINIGEVTGVNTDALNLSNVQLTHLSVDELQLTSRQAINFYGNVGQVDDKGQLLAKDGSLVPLQFGQLAISAAGFKGFDNQDKVVRLQADNLSIQNTAATSTDSVATGSGQLELLTNSYNQGAGNFAISGFNAVNINPATSQASHFNVAGKSVLTVAGDLNLKTDYLTAAGGADFTINAAGHHVGIKNAGQVDDTTGSGFGASVNVLANAVEFNTRALLASGKLALHATSGDVLVGGQADIDLAGKAVQFADVTEYTPGGTFSAVADQGKITLAGHSKLDLSSGGGTAAGGQLLLKAPQQTIDWSGVVKATSGNAVVDIAHFAPAASFDSLMGLLSQAGIDQSIYFRSRVDGITQAAGQTIKGNGITLVADKAGIDLSGTLDADDKAQGGAIALYAGDKITLQNSSVLTAKGTKGGNVLLSSVDADNDGNSGIGIKAGAAIDVSGDATQGGDVTLRALRDPSQLIKIDPIAANTVKGAAQYYAEGVKKYGNADIANGVINNAVIAKIKADTGAYMTAAHIQQVSDRVDSAIQLRPGVQIDYNGDLTVKNQWDFLQWRYGVNEDVAGNLVMNASGKLLVTKSISDSYLIGANADTGGDLLVPGNSWSYQLTAGADLNGADDFATVNAVGHNLEIQGSHNSPVTVRTGTGDIKVAAGSDVVFKNQYATIYTAGRPTFLPVFDASGNLIGNDRYGSLTSRQLPGAEYGVDGGSLTIKAGNNIQGAASDQFITDWLPRLGNSGSNFPFETRTPTAWGVDVGNFRQNVGAFAGGNVNITAGGNINDLSVMMPSTGKQIGTVESGNKVQVLGAGQLAVNAGGDIAGGAYLLGKGNGTISADGKITGGGQFSKGPQLVMGDSTLALNAKQDIHVSAVSDAMALSSQIQFYTYTDTSGITVKSLSGDVLLGADTSVVRNLLTLDSLDYIRETSIYPGSLQTVAFGGSVAIDEINLFPSSAGELGILAKEGIKANADSINPSGIFMRDVDMRLIPTALSPKLANLSEDSFIDALTSRSATPVALLHKNDKEPARLVTQQGDIQDIQVVLPKQAIIQAGRDLSNLRLDIQNIYNDDVTILSAKRDISYKVELNDVGFLKGVNNATAPFIQISGPGDVLVKTGRNLDLGVSRGLTTVGNKLNSNLSSAGSNITVLAGLNGKPLGYADFISKYLTDYPSDNHFNDFKDANGASIKGASTLITDFMRGRLGDAGLSTATALKLFKNLDAVDYAPIQPQLNALVLPVYQQHQQLSYQGISNGQIQSALGGINANPNEKAIGYDTVIDKYLQHFAVADKFSGVSSIVSGFMRERLNNAGLTDAQALALFKALPSDDYLALQQQLNNAILPAYINEIKESGAASAADKTAGNDRAFSAINTLFPGSELKTDDPAFPWKGNINLIFSTLQTVEGGNINLLVPGGNVNAGLAFAFPGLEAKKSSDLGIIAQKEGDINAIVRSNFAVNQSRVFTQSGGNIAIWSTEGNIDAGRGAKTALSVPETIVTASSGGKKTIVRPAVSGSGVRAAAPRDNVGGAGDVFLFAPGGVVDAGEAGIGGSNVTISATAVLGANNIQVGGVGTGVPTASVGSLAAGLTGVSNLSASVSQIAQAATESSGKESATKATKSPKLGVLSVDFMGSGDGASTANDKKKSHPVS